MSKYKLLVGGQTNTQRDIPHRDKHTHQDHDSAWPTGRTK